MNMAGMAKIVWSTSVFTAWNSLRDFCGLTQSDNSMNELLHLRLFISVRCRRRRPGLGTVDHYRPIEYQWIRNRTGVMVRKPPYSFERLVNVYRVRLNVYKIKR